MRFAIFALILLLLNSRLSAQTNAAEGLIQVGTVSHFAISEGSGLAASRRHQDVIWTHSSFSRSTGQVIISARFKWWAPT